jgi:hypothetical protein
MIPLVLEISSSLACARIRESGPHGSARQPITRPDRFDCMRSSTACLLTMSHLSSFAFPPEIVLDVLAKAHPIDVSSFAQTCRAYRDVVYGTTDQQLWRDLYLTQPLDDLRECITVLGRPLVGSDADIDWRTELQNFARAERCIKSLNETGITQVLETLFRLAITFVPSERGRSQNHIWLHDNLCDGAFIAFARVCAGVREPAMRLHTLIGLTKQDYAFAIRARSRAYTYNLAHYTEDTHWGPFKDTHATTTNWLVLQPVHHLICMHVRESTDLGDEKPPNVFSLQGSALSAPDFDGDWIGISGLWHGWCASSPTRARIVDPACSVLRILRSSRTHCIQPFQRT